MKYANLFIGFLLLFSIQCLGQQIDPDYETALLEEEDNLSGTAFKPVLGFGVGSFSFYGDVNDYFRTPLSGLTSTRISVSRNLSRYFDFEFNGTFGNVTGNEYNGDSSQFLNFKTSLFLGGVSLYYNFNHILKRKRPIHPYLGLGVEILQFTPKADLYNANHIRYNYWSDGTIRDVAPGPEQIGNLIQRDYDYETDLRSLNLYGYGDYSKTSFAIPVDVGVNVTVSDRVTFRLGSTFHLAMTDYIDNRKGGGLWKNDVILNTYACLTFDMFSPADEITAVENFKNLKFTITDKQDEDGDGVDDFNDECPDTPKGVKVNYKGCPIDTDKDGIPDYLDKQPETPSGSLAVSLNGVRMSESQLIALLYDPDAVKRSEMKLYTQKTEAKTGEKTKGIPDKFKIVDTNGDNYISLEELQKAIDAVFEMNSTLTPSDIIELQDFFFNQ